MATIAENIALFSSCRSSQLIAKTSDSVYGSKCNYKHKQNVKTSDIIRNKICVKLVVFVKLN